MTSAALLGFPASSVTSSSYVVPSDAKANGLVDVLGGLETAITIAKERAGLSRDQHVKIIEIPKKGLFDLGMFMPKLFGIETTLASDTTIEMLKLDSDEQNLL